MGYSSKTELIQALANALSQGTAINPGTTLPITSVGKLLADTVTDDQVFQYIKWADQNIDAAISSIYQIPLSRVNLGSYPLALDITAGDLQLILADATRFTTDDVILVRDETSGQFQQLTISDTPNDNTLVFTTPIILSYSSLTTNVELIRYPDPIPKMSARLAAAYLYDKHFAAQVEGNESDYGKYLRKLYYQDLNNLLAGVVRLMLPDAGQLTGRRYYNPVLDDVINTRAKPGDQWYKAE